MEAMEAAPKAGRGGDDGCGGGVGGCDDQMSLDDGGKKMVRFFRVHVLLHSHHIAFLFYLRIIMGVGIGAPAAAAGQLRCVWGGVQSVRAGGRWLVRGPS